MSLERSELSAHIEDAVVRGLGRHLAASLLRDAAEQHRMERQPDERTKQRAQAAGAFFLPVPPP